MSPIAEEMSTIIDAFFEGLPQGTGFRDGQKKFDSWANKVGPNGVKPTELEKNVMATQIHLIILRKVDPSTIKGLPADWRNPLFYKPSIRKN